jgi:hypothetical protein
MKLFLAFIFLFAITIYSQDSRTISIIKNQQDDFEIFSNGKMIYKLNTKNCDSASLATLEDIYYESTKDSSMSTNINILNLPAEDGFDWINIIIPLAVIILTYLTARMMYNRQVRAESKKAWLEKVRIEGARMLYISDFLVTVSDKNDKIKQRLETVKKYKFEENTEAELLTQKTILEEILKDNQEIEKHTKELENEFRESLYRFRFLFHPKTHASFLNKWINFSASFKEEQKILKEKFNEFTLAMAELISEEQDKLDRGEF